ncbi:MAG: hypothetical protein J6P44_01355 [Bacteroidales bacterium]|nr:hypothetical protein [Bacteroidales bacterium]
MKRIYVLITILLCTAALTKAQTVSETEFDDGMSMFKALWTDFKESDVGREEKMACYARYTGLFFKTLYSQVTAPVGYIGYYMFRKQITSRLEEFYKQHGLEDIENVGRDIASGKIDKQELKNSMGAGYYNLWLYGDTTDPLITGGVPEDYKPQLPMFWRRWFYGGVRNPRWNATYINNYSADVTAVVTTYDTRVQTVTHNYGTSDTRLGTWLRWYVDKDGKWWFFYEKTKRTNKNKGKLFYFGAVGLGSKDDGFYKDGIKQGRFEFSLNRTVTIDE